MKTRITRREFIKYCQAVSMGALLAACGQPPKPATPSRASASATKALPSPTFVPTSTAAPTETLALTETPEPSSTASPTARPQFLRDFAQLANFYIGVAIGGGSVADYDTMMGLQQREFNAALHYLGWDEVEPEQENVFNWGPTDSDVDFAVEHNMQTLGHPLVWCQGLPGWLSQASFSRDDLLQRMVTHIQTVMDRYKDSIHHWVVVNEANHRRGDVFAKTIGSDYIELAFRTAREADPKAFLIYNDYDNHTPSGPRKQLTQDIIASLRSKGLVDGVGLQCTTLAIEPPKKPDVIVTMQSYGLPVYVTEFAVLLRQLKGTPQDRLQRQAEIYQTMLEAALESGVCDHFYVFGASDRYTVWEAEDQPVLFDANFEPKPAYSAILDVLKQHSS